MRRTFVSFLLAVLAVSPPALAGSATVSGINSSSSVPFDITVQVSSSCAVSATNADFGTYDGSTSLTSSATLTFDCTAGAQYSFIVTTGSVTGSGAPVLVRNGGSETLGYELVDITDSGGYAGLDDSDPSGLGSVTVTASSSPFIRTLTFSLGDGQAATPGIYQAQQDVEVTLLN